MKFIYYFYLLIIVSKIILSCNRADDFVENDKIGIQPTNSFNRTLSGPINRITATQWILNETASAESEKKRAMLSLSFADQNPVGLRLHANTRLTINVTILSGNALPTLVIGTYDREAVTIHQLKEGNNSIINPNGGDLYLKFSSDHPSASNSVKVDFKEGYSTIPFYILGVNSNAQWKEMLASSSAPNAILVSHKSFIVCSREIAKKYENKNQDLVLSRIDLALSIENSIGYMDVPTPWTGNVMIIERKSGYMDSESDGKIRVIGSQFERVLDPDVIQNNGWGLFHEMGHHHQMYNWNFDAVHEVNPNIYTLAVMRTMKPGYKWLTGSNWTDLQKYFEKSSRDYTASTTSGEVRLALYEQLRLAFGEGFFINLHKLIRQDRPNAVNNEQKMRVLMIYASKASGFNLSSFFKKYGFKVNQSIYNEINALNLPNFPADITTYKEP